MCAKCLLKPLMKTHWSTNNPIVFTMRKWLRLGKQQKFKRKLYLYSNWPSCLDDFLQAKHPWRSCEDGRVEPSHPTFLELQHQRLMITDGRPTSTCSIPRVESKSATIPKDTENHEHTTSVWVTPWTGLLFSNPYENTTLQQLKARICLSSPKWRQKSARSPTVTSILKESWLAIRF